jgi:hypothetical protein
MAKAAVEQGFHRQLRAGLCLQLERAALDPTRRSLAFTGAKHYTCVRKYPVIAPVRDRSTPIRRTTRGNITDNRYC